MFTANNNSVLFWALSDSAAYLALTKQLDADHFSIGAELLEVMKRCQQEALFQAQVPTLLGSETSSSV